MEKIFSSEMESVLLSKSLIKWYGTVASCKSNVSVLLSANDFPFPFEHFEHELSVGVSMMTGFATGKRTSITQKNESTLFTISFTCIFVNNKQRSFTKYFRAIFASPNRFIAVNNFDVMLDYRSKI